MISSPQLVEPLFVKSPRSERPRVLHVVRSLEVGGLERVVCELIKARGFEDTRVACLTARGEFADLLEDGGGYVYDLSASHRSRCQLFARLVSVMRAFRPEVVHCHNMFAHALGVLAATWSGRIPTVLTKHGTHLPRAWTSGLLHHALVRRSHVVAVSTEIRDKMQAWAPFLNERLSYIPNGLTLPARNREQCGRDARAAMGWKEDEWIVISVSRIVAGKRLDLLIGGFEQLQRAHPVSRLVIVGEGPALADLTQRAAAGPASGSICFLGQRMDIPQLLSAADTFVLSSDNEGLPMSVLEAMAAGLPVVATNVGEVPSVVEDGVTGYVVPPQLSQLLAEAMLRLAAEPQAARNMGIRGYERVSSLFSVDTTLRRYEAIYRQVIKK